MINDLLLLSGNDIPFPEAAVTIHQPTIKEIAFIGEEAFFTGLELLKFSKNVLMKEDKKELENTSNFDVLIAILGERNAVMQKNSNCVKMLLTLLFPNKIIKFEKTRIILKENEEESYIDNGNFEQFQKIIIEIFKLDQKDNSLSDINPSGEMASRIADKLKKRHQVLAQEKNQSQKIDLLSRYVSIISVGMRFDINSVLQYTVYQLFDIFKRNELKSAMDIYIQAKLAGAKDMKEAEDWMQDIHSNK